MDARIQDLAVRPRHAEGPVQQAAGQPPPEQLRRCRETAQCHPRATRRDAVLATAPGFQLNGLKREELIATNSMLLHELYFSSLGGDGQSMEPAMKLALDANFGNVQRWREEFVAMGKALGGGSGWVLLTFQPREGTLINQWAADHTHALAGGVPILALDMYEHAYHLDYGADAAAYVDAVMGNLDWTQCTSVTSRLFTPPAKSSAPSMTTSKEPS